MDPIDRVLAERGQPPAPPTGDPIDRVLAERGASAGPSADPIDRVLAERTAPKRTFMQDVVGAGESVRNAIETAAGVLANPMVQVPNMLAVGMAKYGPGAAATADAAANLPAPKLIDGAVNAMAKVLPNIGSHEHSTDQIKVDRYLANLQKKVDSGAMPPEEAAAVADTVAMYQNKEVLPEDEQRQFAVVVDAVNRAAGGKLTSDQAQARAAELMKEGYNAAQAPASLKDDLSLIKDKMTDNIMDTIAVLGGVLSLPEYTYAGAYTPAKQRLDRATKGLKGMAQWAGAALTAKEGPQRNLAITRMENSAEAFLTEVQRLPTAVQEMVMGTASGALEALAQISDGLGLEQRSDGYLPGGAELREHSEAMSREQQNVTFGQADMARYREYEKLQQQVEALPEGPERAAAAQKLDRLTKAHGALFRQIEDAGFSNVGRYLLNKGLDVADTASKVFGGEPVSREVRREITSDPSLTALTRDIATSVTTLGADMAAKLGVKAALKDAGAMAGTARALAEAGDTATVVTKNTLAERFLKGAGDVKWVERTMGKGVAPEAAAAKLREIGAALAGNDAETIIKAMDGLTNEGKAAVREWDIAMQKVGGDHGAAADALKAIAERSGQRFDSLGAKDMIGGDVGPKVRAGSELRDTMQQAFPTFMPGKGLRGTDEAIRAAVEERNLALGRRAARAERAASVAEKTEAFRTSGTVDQAVAEIQRDLQQTSPGVVSREEAMRVLLAEAEGGRKASTFMESLSPHELKELAQNPEAGEFGIRAVESGRIKPADLEELARDLKTPEAVAHAATKQLDEIRPEIPGAEMQPARRRGTVAPPVPPDADPAKRLVRAMRDPADRARMVGTPTVQAAIEAVRKVNRTIHDVEKAAGVLAAPFDPQSLAYRALMRGEDAFVPEHYIAHQLANEPATGVRAFKQKAPGPRAGVLQVPGKADNVNARARNLLNTIHTENYLSRVKHAREYVESVYGEQAGDFLADTVRWERDAQEAMVADRYIDAEAMAKAAMDDQRFAKYDPAMRTAFSEGFDATFDARSTGMWDRIKTKINSGELSGPIIAPPPRLFVDDLSKAVLRRLETHESTMFKYRVVQNTIQSAGKPLGKTAEEVKAALANLDNPSEYVLIRPKTEAAYRYEAGRSTAEQSAEAMAREIDEDWSHKTLFDKVDGAKAAEWIKKTPGDTYLVPKWVAEDTASFLGFNRVVQRFAKGDHGPFMKRIGQAIRVYDFVYDMWRTGATVMRPAYHARNLASDIWRMMVSGVDVGNTGHWTTAKRLLDGKASDRVIQMGAVRMSEKQLLEMVKRQNVLSEARISSVLDSRIADSVPWVKAGEKLEFQRRIVTVMDGLAKGYSPSAATTRMFDALLDYGSLYGAGNAAARRTFGFWSWTRMAIPQQMGYLLKKTGKIRRTLLALQAADDAWQDPAIQAKFLRQGSAIDLPPAGEGIFTWLGLAHASQTDPKSLQFSLQGWLPLMEIQTLKPSEWTKHLNSLPSTAAQFAMNKDFYSGKPIHGETTKYDNYLGISMPESMKWSLKKTMVFTNDLDTANPWGIFGVEGEKKSIFGYERFRDDAPGFARAATAVAAIKLYSSDIRRDMNDLLYNMEKATREAEAEMNKGQDAVNRAKAEGGLVRRMEGTAVNLHGAANALYTARFEHAIALQNWITMAQNGDIQTTPEELADKRKKLELASAATLRASVDLAQVAARHPEDFDEAETARVWENLGRDWHRANRQIQLNRAIVKLAPKNSTARKDAQAIIQAYTAAQTINGELFPNAKKAMNKIKSDMRSARADAKSEEGE